MRKQRKQGGFGYLDVLIAAILIAMVTASGLATWQISTQAANNKRATEMGMYVATTELERLKAQKYASLTPSATPTETNYDRWGNLATGGTTVVYRAKTWITALVDRDTTTNSEDLLEIKIEVWNSARSKKYETLQTLLSSGGI